MDDRYDVFMNFINLLEEHKIQYRISRERDDGLMVTVRVVGYFIELELIDDHFEIAYFRGDESLDRDLDALKSILIARGT